MRPVFYLWFSQGIKTARFSLRSSQARRQLPAVPVYVIEWNPFLSRNYFNDSLWKASYTVKAMADCVGKADGVLYSAFVDQRQTSGHALPLRGEPGALTGTLLRKPVDFALRSLRTMSARLLVNQPGCIITSNSSSRLQMILYHYQHFDSTFYHIQAETDIPPDALNAYLQDVGNHSFSIELTDVEDGEYRIEQYKITKARTSILSRWIESGCFSYEGKFRLLTLLLDSDIDTSLRTAVAVDGRLKINCVLQPSEVFSISITRQ